MPAPSPLRRSLPEDVIAHERPLASAMRARCHPNLYRASLREADEELQTDRPKTVRKARLGRRLTTSPTCAWWPKKVAAD